MPITRQENLRRVLSGQEPAWVPLALNFNQWFKHHKNFGTLPEELAGGDYLDAMKVLGCDIFSRNIDGGHRERDTVLQPERSATEESTGPRVTMRYRTPHGTIESIHQVQTALTTGHDEAYLVKDWQRDGNALRYLLEQREYSWDEAAFLETTRRVGSDGIVNVGCCHTPLKMLHITLGLEYTCMFMADEPKAAGEFCEWFWREKVRPELEILARHAAVESVILMDNVDTPFYPPAMAQLYWEPYVKDAADLMRSHGKHLFVHACGKLAALAPVFARCRVSGLEGISHPPLGDWPAGEAQRCHKDFVFMGGFSAHEQEQPSDDLVRDFYRQYLSTADKKRFIFSSSCQTSIGTKWARLKLVRDICRQWGGSSER
jgi:hypothetical protein